MSAPTFGKRVWAAIEETQGFGFISDDICSWSDDEAYQRAKDALDWERQTVKRLAALVRSYERARDARFARHAAKVLADAVLPVSPDSSHPRGRA